MNGNKRENTKKIVKLIESGKAESYFAAVYTKKDGADVTIYGNPLDNIIMIESLCQSIAASCKRMGLPYDLMKQTADKILSDYTKEIAVDHSHEVGDSDETVD